MTGHLLRSMSLARAGRGSSGETATPKDRTDEGAVAYVDLCNG